MEMLAYQLTKLEGKKEGEEGVVIYLEASIFGIPIHEAEKEKAWCIREE